MQQKSPCAQCDKWMAKYRQLEDEHYALVAKRADAERMQMNGTESDLGSPLFYNSDSDSDSEGLNIAGEASYVMQVTDASND